MNSKLQNLGSDLTRVDAHVIQSDEYDEIPELTDADLARGTWKIAGKVVSRTEGKAAFSAALKKHKINLTLDPDVLAFFKQQAGGRGYQTLINATLREAMRAKSIEETLRRVIREELHIT
ncbi:MAG: BrnA antitoxin family protein [Gallionella sp.]